jgi:hypothetical protein
MAVHSRLLKSTFHSLQQNTVIEPQTSKFHQIDIKDFFTFLFKMVFPIISEYFAFVCASARDIANL